MSLEKNIALYIKEKGINLSAISRQIGVSYMSLYDSLFNENKARPIRGQELVELCIFLGVDPREFVDKDKEVI